MDVSWKKFVLSQVIRGSHISLLRKTGIHLIRGLTQRQAEKDSCRTKPTLSKTREATTLTHQFPHSDLMHLCRAFLSAFVLDLSIGPQRIIGGAF